ncbi:MAG TPA: YceI family protein [Solirubrobacterales bacterium]|jgi:polyisoprenoid-binding protein YceI
MTTSASTKTVIPAGTWKIDPAHSKAGFAVKHMGVSTVRGEFREFEGTIEVGESLDDARAYGTAKVESIDTGVADRDAHLRSPDFFDAENNPEIRFESKRFEATGEDTFKVVGDLTMNGVTREVELDAEVTGVGENMEGEQLLGLEATGVVSRKDFQMKFNAVLGTGNAVVADKVKLQLDLEAIKQA